MNDCQSGGGPQHQLKRWQMIMLKCNLRSFQVSARPLTVYKYPRTTVDEQAIKFAYIYSLRHVYSVYRRRIKFPIDIDSEKRIVTKSE